LSLFRALGRALVDDRALRMNRNRGYSRRRQGRGGFFGPMPYYTRRTRGGSRVTVSGCCLPIPLGLLAGAAVGLRLLIRR
jgi:hypothetical protein